MKPKDLLYAHRYAEAVEAYKRSIKGHPDKNYYSGLGQSLLALKNYDEALDSFRQDDYIESQRSKGYFPSLIFAGTALWLMQKHAEAMYEWHRSAAGILDGSIKYGDLAGGGTQGLLLWYGAITQKAPIELDYSIEYFKFIKRKKKFNSAMCWPYPIILMVLGETSFDEVLSIGCDFSVLGKCFELASKDLLIRRRLCQILFYSACLDRQAGNEAGCAGKMRLCLQLENPIIECEWYLARAEQII